MGGRGGGGGLSILYAINFWPQNVMYPVNSRRLVSPTFMFSIPESLV